MPGGRGVPEQVPAGGEEGRGGPYGAGRAQRGRRSEGEGWRQATRAAASGFIPARKTPQTRLHVLLKGFYNFQHFVLLVGSFDPPYTPWCSKLYQCVLKLRQLQVCYVIS